MEWRRYKMKRSEESGGARGEMKHEVTLQAFTAFGTN
jgi:hypothetical protein